MENIRLLRNFLLLGLLIFFSCTKDDYDAPITNNIDNINESTTKSNSTKSIVYGSSAEVGNGTATLYTLLDRDNNPVEFGIELTKSALENLPKHDFEKMINLEFPSELREIIPFNHIGINWNPGSEENVLLNTSQLNFHFYTISISDREKILAFSPETENAFNLLPPSGYMPLDYEPLANNVGAVENIGNHWASINAEDKPINTGIFYGSYDGNFIFIDLIVSKVFLDAGAKISADFSQPVFTSSNHKYPRSYNVYRSDQGQIYISLSNFISR